ncbi:molybdenum cofactor guanylyltransferase MobA [Ruixingdingia sedimenti]|uniref:Molybdenum cofactor guanylyltransferase n=1 Tax=Ruixingdingia sedimenti TaxID=3073604 RepID=A0ABU1FAE6_9RHOB|nr:molybdenum cofactor guanylyltransferase MobA [Xinfangfangia sp. LG-4]MDR5653840.1 molybdenum cofactor guanylyltransferase MobA [Xinfangfangia sp. LG-4]
MRLAGVILAGGRALRMGGGDKGLRLLGGRAMIAHVIDRLAPQVAFCAISANGDPARFAAFGLPVLADGVAGRPGPLAGVLAGLDHAAGAGMDAIVTAPADAPFLPRDLAGRLAAACTGGPVLARGPDGRAEPVFALWPVALRGALRAALAEGMRGVGDVAARHGAAHAGFDDARAFFNVNTPADLARAEALLAAPG